MKKTIYALAVLAAIGVTSCKEAHDSKLPPVEAAPKTYAEIKKADWFLGRWENNSKEGNLSEIWTKVNDSTSHGETYFVIGKDTVFSESVKLGQKENQLVYEVSVKGQNDEKPVEFALTSSSDKQLIFENPKYDYPTKITYNQITKDSIVAEISGMKDGKPKSEQFAMKKVQ
ncbi:hypothetical protein ABH942_000435 [Flavobacterium sp. 28YEA47A]|uniref:DUF6265 family protein n=1 Tax=Flavobacterium sp. 28YEA47A TaxID=3156276 RepID=UPI003514F569